MTTAADPGALLEPHRRALQLHCYRMTGSLHDAEDLVQETFLRAWQKQGAFRGESSIRTWLYRIATNVCLDALRKRRPPRRLRPPGPAADPSLPVGPPTDQANWLEPYPDAELPGPADGPEETALRREGISLAFTAALQLLPARQRAILILSDVLDWRSSEIAALLHMSVRAVDSALHRARSAIARNNAEGQNAAVLEGKEAKALLDRYLAAWHAADVEALVSLLHEDAVLSMPPFSSWYEGRDAVCAILSLHPFGFGKRGGWRLSPTHANGQPAFVLHRADTAGAPCSAFGIMVVSLASTPRGPSLAALTVYKDPALVARFAFPPQLPGTEA